MKKKLIVVFRGQPLTNEDFRKLMMTPLPPGAAKSQPEATLEPKETPKVSGEDAAARRKKKKM